MQFKVPGLAGASGVRQADEAPCMLAMPFLTGCAAGGASRISVFAENTGDFHG